MTTERKNEPWGRSAPCFSLSTTILQAHHHHHRRRRRRRQQEQRRSSKEAKVSSLLNTQKSPKSEKISIHLSHSRKDICGMMDDVFYLSSTPGSLFSSQQIALRRLLVKNELDWFVLLMECKNYGQRA
jgi:hypothetical protein